MSKLYVTDALLFNGREYGRGETISFENDKLREQLLNSGQVSTTKPSSLPVPTAEGAPVTITNFSDEELLAEVAERDLITKDSKVDYAELTIDELKALCADRELDVERGDGKKGNLLQADYVAALEAADAADAS
jgi:hypothetical protein